jgi:hypothetical protein
MGVYNRDGRQRSAGGLLAGQPKRIPSVERVFYLAFKAVKDAIRIDPLSMWVSE